MLMGLHHLGVDATGPREVLHDGDTKVPDALPSLHWGVMLDVELVLATQAQLYT